MKALNSVFRRYCGAVLENGPPAAELLRASKARRLRERSASTTFCGRAGSGGRYIEVRLVSKQALGKWMGVLIIALSTPLALWPQQNEKQQLQRQKEQLQEEIAMANKILDKTQKNKKATLVTIETVQQKIRLRENLIRTLNRETEMVREESQALQEEIDSLQEQVDRQKERYATMIRHAYKSKSNISRLMFLFASEDFSQALRRLEYLKQYADYRKRQIEEIRENQRKLEEKQESLEVQLVRKKALREQLEQEKSRLSDERLTQEQAIAEYKDLTEDLRQKLERKQRKAREVQQEIERLIALEVKRAKERAARQKLENEAQNLGLKEGVNYDKDLSNKKLKELIAATRADMKAAERARSDAAAEDNSYELTPEARRLAANFSANQERLPWPVDKGLLVSRFGSQRHPVVKSVIIDNKGIDIATEEGAAVKAVFQGKVSNVILLPNGFRAAILNHGEYFTVYQNLSSMEITSGQEVQKGTILGKVALDRGTSQHRLHFEVWKSDRAMNPLQWLASR